MTEPSRDASAALCLMLGTQSFQDNIDENSLQGILIQMAARDPRFMLNVQPNITSIRDFPSLQHLMSMLIEESTRFHSIMNTCGDQNQERLLTKRVLQRDLEALKHEINDTLRFNGRGVA